MRIDGAPSGAVETAACSWAVAGAATEPVDIQHQRLLVRVAIQGNLAAKSMVLSGRLMKSNAERAKKPVAVSFCQRRGDRFSCHTPLGREV